MDALPLGHVCRRRRSAAVAIATAASAAAVMMVVLVATTTANATAVASALLAVAGGESGAVGGDGAMATAALTTSGRQACPTGACKCKRLGVEAAVAMANTIFEVLVMSCGTGGYKVRINQYYKGCSRQATTAGVRSSSIALPIDRSCPPSLLVGHTYVVGMMGKGGALGGTASGCGLVVDLSAAGAVAALRPVYAFPRKPCNAVINGNCAAGTVGPRKV